MGEGDVQQWAEGRTGWVGQAVGLTAEGAQLPTAVGLEKGSREGPGCCSAQCCHSGIGELPAAAQVPGPTLLLPQAWEVPPL